MARTVVVGVDGTYRSHDALLWAAQAARSRTDALEIVHAIGLPYSRADRVYDDDADHGAQRLLHVESERALGVAPGLTVRTTLSRSTPGKALTAASEHAALVVVGADGSPDSVAAVAAAAAEADRSGGDLTVVHAWRSPGTYRSVDIVSEPPDKRIEQDERAVLAESLAGLGERYPDLVVHRRLVHSRPANALLDASNGARLLVVGSRGLGGVARMLLCSVSHTLVMHRRCPALVVRT